VDLHPVEEALPNGLAFGLSRVQAQASASIEDGKTSRMKAPMLRGFFAAVLASVSVTAAQAEDGAWTELSPRPASGLLGIFDPSLVAGEAEGLAV